MTWGYLSGELNKPFWVVLYGIDDEPRRRFCRGHDDEAAAQNDATDRTARAKDIGISATYSVIPKP